MKRPNFILISADNLGCGDWGCFGSLVHRTPHTDRMVAEGMRLTHFLQQQWEMYAVAIKSDDRLLSAEGEHARR